MNNRKIDLTNMYKNIKFDFNKRTSKIKKQKQLNNKRKVKTKAEDLINKISLKQT